MADAVTLSLPADQAHQPAPSARYPQRLPSDGNSGVASSWRALQARLGWGARERLSQAMDFAERVGTQWQHGSTSSVGPAPVVPMAQMIPVGEAALRAFDEQWLVGAFARVCRLSRQTLGLQPYPVQVAAARLMLGGALVEMATGEGKSLVVALATAVAALKGWRVHAMTANDYLAARDAERMKPLFDALEMSVGCVVSATDEAARRTAYRSQVVYTTAREVAFDWLRDRVRHGEATDDLALDFAALHQPPLLCGLAMAIVDEADAVLLDEARTPLVLAVRDADAGMPDALHAMTVARALTQGDHFHLDADTRPRLTVRGEALVARLSEERAEALGTLWRHDVYRREQVTQALVALHTLLRDRDYVVRDDAVHIVDANTGRMAEGRRWSRGLHALMELKEGVSPGGQQRTMASVTYQRFFPRYLKLAGTSGTLMSARAELAATYGLSVVPVPQRLPSQRRLLPIRTFADDRLQAHAIALRARELSSQGRPVLIGMGSVEASERLSRALHAAGVGHTLLNAREDADEAAIVARAGHPGRVTLSTAMAGRGTDIALGPGVARRGGLTVILAAVGRSSRIDLQLMGRAGRHGEPGRVEVYVSLQDPLLLKTAGMVPMTVLSTLERRFGGLPPGLVDALVRCCQWRGEWIDASERRRALADDVSRSRALSLAGGDL